MARIKSYAHGTGLKGEAQGKLAGIIGRAVADGLNPRASAKLSAEGLDVTNSKVRQYAQTDIADMLRQARWAESEATSEELGIKIGMLWTSALPPTTRRTHATRNGGVYSTDEVRAFYSRDGNRYNYNGHCGQTECLLETMRQQFLDPAGPVRGQTRKNVLQVSIELMPVHAPWRKSMCWAAVTLGRMTQLPLTSVCSW